ncbi:MAG: alpha/beta hydrolase [Chroococcidiopsidaceae cyanobacterium CP_BM_ER_R8_30]|nr:alpha/beta hydrolase [Chroococcidiopsidaceae cyanobacterium CP_BM_ER_R8_30]
MLHPVQLDGKVRLLTWLLRWSSKPANEMTLQEIEQQSQTPISPIVARIMLGQSLPMQKITDVVTAGRHGDIPLKLYYPRQQSALGVIVFFHGGGWIGGNFQTHDAMCRRLAHQSGVAVIAVGYRLAPRYPFAIALEDGYDTLQWVVQQAASLGVDANSLIVIGDSAGGNLAAALCLMAKDAQKPNIRGQVLLYPITDGTLSQPSVKQYANGPYLTKAQLKRFVQDYARTPNDIYHPYFSPLLATNLTQLPPALIITGQYDPLHDEGQAYAERLRLAGNQVQFTDYMGMIHGFLSFPGFCHGAKPAFAEIAAFIDSLFKEPSVTQWSS